MFGIILNTKPINKKLNEYTKIKELIARAFPKNEQLPMWLLRLLATTRSINFIAYYDAETFCGITYTVQTENMVFVLYLAVNNEIRSKGYGSAILAHLKNIHGRKTISLNVEALNPDAENYAQRVKRVEFYKRNGFENTNYFLTDNGDKYLILSTSSHFCASDYKIALKKMYFGFYAPKIETQQ